MLENAEKLNDQAVKLAHSGSVKEAIACFKRAITLDRSNHLFWFNLGITFRNNGELKEARKSLEKAYEINPYDSEVIETLAIICFEMDDFNAALKYCYEGLDYNPENSNLWNITGVVYFNQKEYTDAAEAFETAVTINPYHYDALFNLKDTYEELGNKIGASEIERRMSAIKKMENN